MFSTLTTQIGAGLMAGACLYAASSRGRPQVLASACVVVAWVGSAALQDTRNLVDPQYAIFALDVVASLVLLGLSLRYREAWLMWMAAFQLLPTMTHVAVMIDLRINVWAYFTTQFVWSHLLLIALAWGGWQGHRARRAAKAQALAAPLL